MDKIKKHLLTPVKNGVGRLVARASDRRNQAGRSLKKNFTDLTIKASGSSGLSTPPATPQAPNDEDTLAVAFASSEQLPSPPLKKDMTMREVHETLSVICPSFEQLLRSEAPAENEKYWKLVYAVGQGFFDHLLIHIDDPDPHPDMKGLIDAGKAVASHAAKLIVNRIHPAGQRFHILFSVHDATDRKWTLEENEKVGIIEEYEYYVDHQRLPHVEKFRRERKDDIYEVFNDMETFKNLRPQYQVQYQGNCFAQAAILAHFYLQLVHDKNLTKEEALISDLSRFMRNFYSGDKLYKCTINDEGDDYTAVLNKLLRGDYDLRGDIGDAKFEDYVFRLKTHGPAFVKMFVGTDFHRKWKFDYHGKPPGEAKKRQGHTMLLVGVLNVRGEEEDVGNALLQGTDLYYILQNFWDHKQFVMVRRDYFRECSKPNTPGGQATVKFVVYNDANGFRSADQEAIYARKAEHDVSLSSNLLERATCAKSRIRIRSMDSSGLRSTKWV